MKSRPRVSGLEGLKMKITTARLELRAYTPDDYIAWRTGYEGRRPKRHRFDPGPVEAADISRPAFRRVLKLHRRARELDKLYVLGIFEKSTGRHLGYVDLYVLSRLDFQIANLGYALHNQFWGLGFAREAVRGAFEFAFRKLKLHRLEAGIEPGNRASISVAQAIGMKPEGLRDRVIFEDGRWKSLLYFSISAERLGIKRSRPIVSTRFLDLL
jgi:[ribosomal protein S5]-alanine N-acetyltransferase